MQINKANFVRLFAAAALLASPALVSGPLPASADTTFPQTGQRIWGPFEAYWNAHGGLAQFGLPRTSVYPAKDGNYDAQWFERALFTYNAAKPDPYKVELQLLGNVVSANRKGAGEAPFQQAAAGAGLPTANTGGYQYFKETGHNLSGKFLQYWKSHGGLPIYGYPISEPFMEKSKSDGKEYVVQYFERNRLELHPEQAGTAYEVQLGLLGSELLDASGGPAAYANLGPPHSYPAPGTASAYPKMGHAPDYSWVAGQVVFTRIQGGCVFVHTDTESFSPNGEGWQSEQVQNGDFVVIFGHLAKQGEPIEICPGGQPYIVDRVMMNP